VIGLDDLYLLLYTHWVLDHATYTDERQRVQVASGILAAVFFGCRPCFLFDTRVKFEDSNNPDEPHDTVAVVHTTNGRKGSDEVKMDRGHHMKKCYDGDTVMAIDSGCEVDDVTSTTSDENSDSDSNSNNYSQNDEDSDSDGDSSSVDAYDEDLDTDDDCDAGPEKTRTFLY